MSYAYLRAIAEGVDPSSMDETTLKELKADYDAGRKKGYNRRDSLMYGLTVGFVKDDFVNKKRLKDSEVKHKEEDRLRAKAEKREERAKKRAKFFHKNESSGDYIYDMRAISLGWDPTIVECYGGKLCLEFEPTQVDDLISMAESMGDQIEESN